MRTENERLCPKFLQVNLNRCRSAQDLLLNRVSAWGIPCGDFNAKHVPWSGYANNARARLLKEWFDSRHFVVRNKREAKTCVRATGESAIDLTVSSVAAAAWVSG